jgi:hypothetical protein
MTSHTVWVRIELDGKEFTEEVSLGPGQSISLFKKRIKAEFSKTLAAYDTAQLTLYHPDGTTAIQPTATIESLGSAGTDGEAPLIVRAVEPARKSAISCTRHSEYRPSRAVHASREFLTSIALELQEIYGIPKQETPSGIEKTITFGTIIYCSNHQNPDPLPQFRPKFTKSLKDLFTQVEWNTLTSLHNAVNGHLHKALNPGQEVKTLILPVQFSSDGEFFQMVAERCNVVKVASNLIIKNEGRR